MGCEPRATLPASAIEPEGRQKLMREGWSRLLGGLGCSLQERRRAPGSAPPSSLPLSLSHQLLHPFWFGGATEQELARGRQWHCSPLEPALLHCSQARPDSAAWSAAAAASCKWLHWAGQR